MPPKHRKQNAHPKDRRHESGLARPGKQIKKQKSDGLLNGHADKASSVTTSDSAADTSLDSHPRAASSALDNELDESWDGSSAAYEASVGGNGERSPSHSLHRDILGDRVVNGNMDSTKTFPYEPQDPGDKSESGLNSGTTPQTTVIWPCSVRDVIAILLLLLQLPPTILTMIHFCFAFLTFGSTSSGWSVSSIPTAPEWLHSHGGNPSLVTTILTDIVFLVLWVLLPVGKDLTLDLSQAVVAISLAGGATGRSGRTHSVVCMVIIAVYHLMRHRQSRHYAATIIWTLISQANLDSYSFPAYVPEFKIIPYPERNWGRTLVELHILTQGVVRIIRRSYMRPAVPKNNARKGEVDLSSGSIGSPSGNPNPSVTEGGRNSSTDGRQPGPSPATRESKEKSSGKKRRKQATFVRSQQPFWAAIASTKVTVSKELEQSQASRDSFEAGATDIQHLGCASRNGLDDRIWITDIRDTEVWFSFARTQDGNGDDEKEGTDENDDDDTSLHVSVKVNKADWSSVSHQDNEVDSGKNGKSGRVFGLTPSTNYTLEFSRSSDNQLLLSANLLTSSAASLVEGMLSPLPSIRLLPLTLRRSSHHFSISTDVASLFADDYFKELYFIC